MYRFRLRSSFGNLSGRLRTYSLRAVSGPAYFVDLRSFRNGNHLRSVWDAFFGHSSSCPWRPSRGCSHGVRLGIMIFAPSVVKLSSPQKFMKAALELRDRAFIAAMLGSINHDTDDEDKAIQEKGYEIHGGCAEAIMKRYRTLLRHR